MIHAQSFLLVAIVAMSSRRLAQNGGFVEQQLDRQLAIVTVHLVGADVD